MERTITDDDAKAIAEQMHNLHICRFQSISSTDMFSAADMAFIKDLLGLYKETRSVVIKWTISIVLRVLFYGTIAIAIVTAYFKLRGER